MDILSALQVVTQSIKNWTQNKIDGIELGSQSDWNENDAASPSYIKNKPVISGGGVSNHNDLTNRDAANQHPISAITNLQYELDNKASVDNILFSSIDTNTLKIENNILSINTTDDAEEDNTKPITSSGVNTIVGNINILLSKI